MGTVSFPFSVTVDPSGRFVYVANNASSNISAYTINQSTGALTEILPRVPAGNWPNSVTVDPSGRFAYVANLNSSNISAYTINQSTGVLTPIGSVPAGTLPSSVTVDPSGRFVYVANLNSNNISTLQYDRPEYWGADGNSAAHARRKLSRFGDDDGWAAIAST